MLRLPDPDVPGDVGPAEPRPASVQRKPARRQAPRRTPGKGDRAIRADRAAKPLAAVPSASGAPQGGGADQAEIPTPSGNGAASNPLFKAIDGGLVDGDGPRERARRPRPSGTRARADAPPRRQAARLRASAAPTDGSGLRPECYACPVGIAFGTVRGASPETLDHLMAASRELVAAARTVMEALEANLERRGRTGPLQHIDLD